jgi:hypothetical protein
MKTTVEFLQEALSSHLTDEQQMQFEGLFQQALEMEKWQIQDAYTMGSYDMADKKFNPSQYYNDIFKND